MLKRGCTPSALRRAVLRSQSHRLSMRACHQQCAEPAPARCVHDSYGVNTGKAAARDAGHDGVASLKVPQTLKQRQVRIVRGRDRTQYRCVSSRQVLGALTWKVCCSFGDQLAVDGAHARPHHTVLEGRYEDELVALQLARLEQRAHRDGPCAVSVVDRV